MSLISANDDNGLQQMSADAATKSFSTVTVKRTTKVTTVRKGSPSNVYNTSGTRLSKEALYRAKLKYGVYESPLVNSTSGGNAGFADKKQVVHAAAQLANENEDKLKIASYKRIIDPNATRAAKHTGASSAAAAALHMNKQTSNVGGYKVGISGSQNAASKAYSLDSTASRNKESLTSGKGGVNRRRAGSNTYSISSAVSALSNDSAAVPIVPQGNTSSFPAMDLSKVLKGAELNAEQRIKARIAPERKNYTNGLLTNLHDGTEGMSRTSTFQSNLLPMVSATASTSDASRERELQKLNEHKRLAQVAASAVKDLDPKSLIVSDEESMRREALRKEFLAQLTSEQVLSMAQANTNSRLNIINQDIQRMSATRLFDNEALNQKALDIARERYSNIPAHDPRVNLGGGLMLSNEEISNIANKMISPVLGEINERAESQRLADEEIKERVATFKADFIALEALHRSKLVNNDKLKVYTRSRIENEKTLAQSTQKQKYDNMVAMMEQKVAAKENEVATNKANLYALRAENHKSIADYEEHTKNDLLGWTENRQIDLESAKKEQSVLLQPYQYEITKAEKEHDELLAQKDLITASIDKLHASIESHKSKILELETDLKDKEQKQVEEDARVKELTDDKQYLSTHIDETLIVKANKVKEETQLSSEQANLRQLEIDAIINERKSELNKVELDLKKEKLKLMEALGKNAELKGEPKIDEAKLKNLIGISPSTELLVGDQVESSMKDIRTAEATAKTRAAPSINVDKADSSNTNNHNNENGTFQSESASVAAPSASAKSVTAVSGVITDITNKANIPKIRSPNQPAVSSPLASKAPDYASQQDETAHEAGEVKSTFSGFSQGTIPEDSDERDAVSGLSSEHAHDNSYFTEVF